MQLEDACFADIAAELSKRPVKYALVCLEELADGIDNGVFSNLEPALLVRLLACAGKYVVYRIENGD